MSLNKLTINQFLEKSSSDEALPAGGSTLALCGALAAALAEKVAKVTFGKAKYADYEIRLREICSELNSARLLLTSYINCDADAYQGVFDAYKLPKSSVEVAGVRKREIENSLKAATLVQMNVAEKCHEFYNYIKEMINIVEGSLKADVTVSLMICATAAKGAVINVETNLHHVDDEEFKREMIVKCNIINKDIDIY